MEITTIKNELRKVNLDAKTNIKLVKLTGNKEISVYAAEIFPQTHLTPHYHEFGIEIYQIIEGNGEMKIGTKQNNSVAWEEKFAVKAGDFFSIDAGKIHQISNTSDKNLFALFTCPESHLTTDRYFI